MPSVVAAKLASLQARGLEMRRHGEVLWVAPREEMLARERQELEQKAQIADLEALHAESFQLNYQRADTLRRSDLFRSGNSRRHRGPDSRAQAKRHR